MCLFKQMQYNLHAFTIQMTAIQAHLPGLPSVNSFQRSVLCLLARLSLGHWKSAGIMYSSYGLSGIAVSPPLHTAALHFAFNATCHSRRCHRNLPAEDQIEREERGRPTSKRCCTFFLLSIEEIY